MLHVFNVNYGRMLTFDVNLAMERVLDLKNAISSSQGVHPDKQVMLISGGQALCDDERVCSYAAGTETNPVYLFDKACIEKETLQHPSEYRPDNDFSESISNALTLSPSYKTVEARTKLAMRLHEATRRQVTTMKALVHDEHLMYQGWQAAVANLLDTVAGFHNRMEVMCQQCQKLFEMSARNEHVMKGMDAVLSQLEKIPLLPALLKHPAGQGRSADDSFEISLLRWIETQCKNISVRAMLSECMQKKGYLSQEKYAALVEDCNKVNAQSSSNRMSEVSGINERLAALDNLVISAEQKVRDQTGIAQGFVRNRETARELHNNTSSIDALLTLCESHVTQLLIMKEYEAAAREALMKCSHAKIELAANLHTRLRWLYFVQRSILNADVKLSMFTQQLTHLQRQITFLDQVKKCPTLYLSAIAEVVRRKNFANLYIQWANKAVSEAHVERDREIVKRKHFQLNLSGHFIQRLFHGFSDKPPSLAKKPLRSFDTNLPDITPEHLSILSQLLPDYKEILLVPSVNPHSFLLQSSPARSPTLSELTIGQSSMMAAATGSTMSIGGTSTSVSASQGKVRTTSGSFAVVDPPVIGQSQPGGFVVTSIEGVTQENMKDDVNGQKPMTKHPRKASDNLPQRSFSTSALHDSDSTYAGSSRVDRSESDSVFAQIGDIISPESPPDSDFFSILPGSFPGQKDSLKVRGAEALSEVDGESSEMSDVKSQDGRRCSRSSMKHSLAVGSPDSNSSTSYQKVDGISSDDEMFHSFTSDPGKDLKSTRKKLHQLQSEYDSLMNETKQEKEEMNLVIRKLQGQVSEMEGSQMRVESDYERRWAESKAELDDVIKQLENERIERKKAWTEGASLEKRLQEMQELCSRHQAQAAELQAKLCVETDNVAKLEAAFVECKDASNLHDEETNQKHEHYISELNDNHQKELKTHKVAVTRIEKDLNLAHAELSSAEDRIQDLETLLSDRERSQEECNEQISDLEATVGRLTEDLKLSQDSYQESIEQHARYEQDLLEQRLKTEKANAQIFSLKNLLGDYESRLKDDKSKDDLMRSMKSSLSCLEAEKCGLTSDLKSYKLEIENLRKALDASQAETHNTQTLAEHAEKSHAEEVQKLRSFHSEELAAVAQKYEQNIQRLNQKHDEEMEHIMEDNRRKAKELEEEWDNKEKELTNIHRNELDEIEADRLESVAAAQQSIEDLRSKVRDSNRLIDQQKKEMNQLKETLDEKTKYQEEERSRLLEESEHLRQEKSQLEIELSECRDTLQDLRSSRKVAVEEMTTASFYPSQLTSSTEDEMESKRSKIDSGISEMELESLQRSSAGMSTSTDANDNAMSISVDDHKKLINVMRRNFDEDKKALQGMFKKREEEAARRRQMVFNSAIQRVTSSKDVEIRKLREMLHSKSLTTAMSQSMMVPSSSPMTPLTPPPMSLPSPTAATPTLPTKGQSESPALEMSMEVAAKIHDSRERDKVTVTNFQVGDAVLVCYNESYQHFILFTTSRVLHFVHGESLEKLGIASGSSDSKKTMAFATLVSKEYCQARKAQNRFRVPISTKFYRVKVSPMSKKDS